MDGFMHDHITSTSSPISSHKVMNTYERRYVDTLFVQKAIQSKNAVTIHLAHKCVYWTGAHRFASASNGINWNWIYRNVESWKRKCIAQRTLHVRAVAVGTKQSSYYGVALCEYTRLRALTKWAGVCLRVCNTINCTYTKDVTTRWSHTSIYICFVHQRPPNNK